jgi:CheY-like chemotaxis protein
MPVILCVDDEPNQLVLYRFLLQQAGFEVILANNGQEAIDITRIVQPNLILMDMMMPIKDGCQATTEIRMISNLAHIPIILLTAYRPHVLATRAAEAGITAILSKMITPMDLLAKIQAYLSVDVANSPSCA